jgi:predicted permease
MLEDLRLRMRALLDRGGSERDMDDELAFHFEHLVERHVRSGLSRAEAVRQARLEFGGVSQVKEEYRAALGLDALRDFGRDLLFACRRLRAAPVFTLLAICSLSIGIAVTTVAYSTVDSLLPRGLGVTRPEQVAFVVAGDEGRLLQGTISEADFAVLEANLSSLGGLAASETLSIPFASASFAELRPAEAVSGAYFSTLLVAPVYGRMLSADDDAQRREVVVIGDTLARRYFGRPWQALGRSIHLWDRPFEIVGVAPPTFSGIASGIGGTQVWLPLHAVPSTGAGPGPAATASQRPRRLLAFGRLSDDDARPASGQIRTVAARLDRDMPVEPAHPERRSRFWRAQTITELVHTDARLRQIGLVLVGLVGLVLVVACTNVANLILARAASRSRDTAVRSAIGARRWHLIREQSLEGAFLAVAGTAVAVGLFMWMASVIRTDIPIHLPNGQQLLLQIRAALDGGVATVTMIALGACVLIVGLEPAWQITGSVDVRGALQAGTGLGPLKIRRQRMLIRWQVTIAASFFVVATMLGRFLVDTTRHDSGIALDQLAVALLDVSAQNPNPQAIATMVDRMTGGAGETHRPELMAISSSLPFGTGNQRRLQVALDSWGDTHEAAGILASPTIFRTLGVSLLRGRAFDDGPGGAAEVVISAAAARAIYGSLDVVGRPLVVKNGASPATRTVVGVAADTDVGRLFLEPRPVVYAPMPPTYDTHLVVTIRSRDDGGALRMLREVLSRGGPAVAVTTADTARAVLSGPYLLLEWIGVGTVSLGAITLLLAAAGLYGIQSQLVSARRAEIGLRMTLGATSRQIRRMVLIEGLRPVLDGLVLGLVAGSVGRVIVRAYAGLEVAWLDPWVLALTPVPILVVAALACDLPARAAAAVDPNVALRQA